MQPDLLHRARSASTLEEEALVIFEAVQHSALPVDQRRELCRIVMMAGKDMPRPALLGVVAALAPDGWVIRCEPRFYADSERTRWFAHALRPHWDRWHPDDEEWIDLVSAEADSELSARLIVTLKAAAKDASHAG